MYKSIGLHILAIIILLTTLIGVRESFSDMGSANCTQTVVERWIREIRKPFPDDFVLLSLRHYIRAVRNRQQSYIMNNSGKLWRSIGLKYGGKYGRSDNNLANNMYSLDWCIFHELEKNRPLNQENFNGFMDDYLKVLSELLITVPDTTKIKYFFNTYYTNWLISLINHSDQGDRNRALFSEAMTDLPPDFRESGIQFSDTLENLIKNPKKNRNKIKTLVNEYNKKLFKRNRVYLTANYINKKKPAVVINAFRIKAQMEVPVRLGKRIIHIPVFFLKSIDNLNIKIRTPGYYHNGEVCIFLDNRTYAHDEFEGFFIENKPFSLLDVFLDRKSATVLYRRGRISKDSYQEMVAFVRWLHEGDGNIFLGHLDLLSRQNIANTPENFKNLLDESLLCHEVIGHAGTSANGLFGKKKSNTFEYHVDAEFFAYLLQYLYSPVQGLDLSLMFSILSDPRSFSNQYGYNFLKMIKMISKDIHRNENLKDRYRKWSREYRYASLRKVTKNVEKFGTLSFQKRISKVLVPISGFLTTLTIPEKQEMLKRIYYSLTAYPIPEKAK